MRSESMGKHIPGKRHGIDEERRKWQDPEAILEDIGVKPGLTFMDIGCGGGFFALPAARMVGPRGRVFGVDAHEESIRELNDLAAGEGLRNVGAVTGKAEETIFCRQCADIIFFGIVLHDFDDAARVLRNAAEMIKPSGILVDLDWDNREMELGPPLRIRFSEEYASGLIKAAGFTIESTRKVGAYHYMVTARPKQDQATAL